MNFLSPYLKLNNPTAFNFIYLLFFLFIIIFKTKIKIRPFIKLNSISCFSCFFRYFIFLILLNINYYIILDRYFLIINQISVIRHPRWLTFFSPYFNIFIHKFQSIFPFFKLIFFNAKDLNIKKTSPRTGIFLLLYFYLILI